ncbi:MAG: nucleoside triphosphate pyrophosphohydrolase [Chloroflexi bacterium]|nr:nucleoside triphosphate pyrophosphohydrolase [Chloroflexota bacterium]
MVYRRKLDRFSTLADIIARLRSPGGCPWDRQQTHLSLKPHLVEECYEVLEAMDHMDTARFSEELGDLLMQIVLHAQIAAEQGDFEMADVLRAINTKLIRRHPHVFGTAKVDNAEQVVQNWEALKQEERQGESVISGLPKAMPALAYSQAIQQPAARVGFDWKQFGDVLDKLAEEVKEVKDVVDHEERVREFGDVLFALANCARWLDIDSEDALRMANERFSQRFRYMEQVCRQRGVVLSSLSLEEQDGLWEQAKENLSQAHPG